MATPSIKILFSFHDEFFDHIKEMKSKGIHFQTYVKHLIREDMAKYQAMTPDQKDHQKMEMEASALRRQEESFNRRYNPEHLISSPIT